MNIDTETIQHRCTDPVFERGQTYRREGRIQQLDRFDDLVSAVVSGSNPYDVTIKFSGRSLETQCTCPYDGQGDCKHVIAVLLAIADDPPEDESERIEALLADVPVEELRAFVHEILATHSTAREQFLAQFGDEHKSVGEYREEIGRLFEQHADPVVFEAIDFSRFFDIAEQYRERDRYLAAATVYRAVFEEVDENFNWIDGSYDHYAQTLQTALDGYIDCVLATDPSPEDFDAYAGVLETRAAAESEINNRQFWRALDDLEDRYDE
ncbi:SWIM zinc finger family protein [Halorubrum halophilum]|uniref:SWIM zinc finger family protein n=1 Tax=Halorubrum halophilum TaxID=413816 RepID=UPI000678CCAD|nr:SWIM zinc finger family protein [Halorubrum halophilum]